MHRLSLFGRKVHLWSSLIPNSRTDSFMINADLLTLIIFSLITFIVPIKCGTFHNQTGHVTIKHNRRMSDKTSRSFRTSHPFFFPLDSFSLPAWSMALVTVRWSATRPERQQGMRKNACEAASVTRLYSDKIFRTNGVSCRLWDAKPFRTTLGQPWFIRCRSAKLLKPAQLLQIVY